MPDNSLWNANLYDDKHSFVWKLGRRRPRTPRYQARRAHPRSRLRHRPPYWQTCRSRRARGRRRPLGRNDPPSPRSLSFAALQSDGRARTRPRWPLRRSLFQCHAALDQRTRTCITSIARLLRPGGRFVAEFGGRGNTGELLKAVDRAWPKLSLPGPAPHPWYYPTIAESPASSKKTVSKPPTPSSLIAPLPSTMASTASATGSTCSAPALSKISPNPPAINSNMR